METYALIGHPIQHSMSPVMHNEHFAAEGRNAVYTAFDIAPELLGEAITSFKTLGIAGWNVTVPHKVKIMDYLDVIDDEAKTIGAVNTVVNRAGVLHGYNTDGRGYLNGLLAMTGPPLKDMSVLIVGAGGAARAVAAVLAKKGVNRLTMTNRTTDKAVEIQKIISADAHLNIIGKDQSLRELSSFDLIINTTSLGLNERDELPIDLRGAKADVYLSDLIYNPLETRWLQSGSARAKSIQNGLAMFVEQGALAYEIWTGEKANRTRMQESVLKEMEE